MKVTFTVGATVNTICDLAADPPIKGVVEDEGGDSVVDVQPQYNQAFKGTYGKGNISGQYVVTARSSYATISASNEAYVAAYNLMQQIGTLVETPPDGPATKTMLNAICKSVRRVYRKGVDLSIRYEFIITTLTTP